MVQSVYWLRYGLDVRGIVVRYSAEERHVSLLRNVRTGSGDHPVSTGGSLLQGKAAEVRHWPLLASVEVTNAWSCISTTALTFMAYKWAFIFIVAERNTSVTWRKHKELQNPVLILSDNCRLSLAAATLLQVWKVGRVGCVQTINEPSGSGIESFQIK